MVLDEVGPLWVQDPDNVLPHDGLVNGPAKRVAVDLQTAATHPVSSEHFGMDVYWEFYF